MKTLTKDHFVMAAVAFLIGAVAGKFIMTLVIILAVVAGLAYGLSLAIKKGMFSK